MFRPKLLLAAPLLLGLGACADDGYYSASSTWYSPYPYYGWYDGYYGSIYDGYWGSNGYFYYRSGSGDRAFRRGDRTHFRRDQTSPGGTWRSLQGNFTPQRSYRMPHYPKRRGR